MAKASPVAKTNEGHPMTAEKHVLRSHISAAQVDRSALNLDTPIKVSEALGQCWTITADNETSIEIDGEKLKLLLKERITRITITLLRLPHLNVAFHGHRTFCLGSPLSMSGCRRGAEPAAGRRY
jgi:hypothetical protein